MISPDRLSLREKAAQLLFPRLGSNLPPPVTAAEDAERFKNLLSECPVGGLVLFNGRFPDTRDALGALQRSSRVPLLVGADMERGVGQQIRGATVFPHAMAYASTGEDGERLLEASARMQAREALACGIHVTFSPVADVNRDPRNPIIATRAFSSDPHVASKLVRAFIGGCKTEGLLATAKHFPGHGNTSQDSHAEMPVVPSRRAELEAFDLAPFRAAIESDVDAVMTAHVVYPALDKEHPATLSSGILRGVLRDELGFKGAVVTDSLLMGAIRNAQGDAGEQAVELVRAGVDVQLDVPDPIAAVEGIAAAVRAGRLDMALVDAAVERVFALKQRIIDRFGEGIFTTPEAALDAAVVGSSAAASIAYEAARRAVRIVDDPDGRIPLRSGPGGANAAGPAASDMVALLVKPHATRFDPEEEPFGAYVRAAFPGIRFHQIGPEEDRRFRDRAFEDAARARLALVALVVKPAAWHAFGLLPEQDELVRRILAATPSVVASMGSPYVLDDYVDAAARVCTYSDVKMSQRAFVDRLVGR
jgi:beta-glucosidase-like glycosyl hydrolase